jgi:type II secretory pathway pseudopilin PulG
MTLIEVVIGLVLVSMLVITFGVTLVAASFAQQAKLRNMAYALADEQLAVLQTKAASQLPIQSNGAPVGIIFNQGGWKAAVDATAPTASNTLETSPATTTGISSIMLMPKNAYGDSTFSAKLKVLAGAPAGWQAGIIFRASDLNNHYQLYLSSTALALKKVVNGTPTTLYSDVRSIALDGWQTLQVVTTGSSMDVYLNGLLVTTQTDATFSSGQSALAVWNGASARFDDVAIGGVTESFDAVTLLDIPSGWRRFGLSDLPSGTATLTTAQLYGDANFVKATVTIGWTDRRGLRSVSQVVYLRN